MPKDRQSHMDYKNSLNERQKGLFTRLRLVYPNIADLISNSFVDMFDSNHMTLADIKSTKEIIRDEFDKELSKYVHPSKEWSECHTFRGVTLTLIDDIVKYI